MTDKVARVFAWFNRQLEPGLPAYLAPGEIATLVATLEGRVRVCARCHGEQIVLADHWRDSLARSGPCPVCSGVGKDRYLIVCESADGEAPWFHGNDESLMRRIIADRGETVDDREVAYQKLHGPRVPPPAFPQPDYGL